VKTCEEEKPVQDTDHARQHAAGTSHKHAAVTPHEHAPGNVDNLLLDIGAGTGALIIHAAADRDQAEVEISPAGSGQPRTHNVVRLRQAPGRSVYAAVFPALAAGGYDVWRDQVTKAGTVLVQGGQVASFRLD
jgi:hypothetical protein